MASNNGWLIDTNVLSETLRPQPDERVMDWLAEVDAQKCYISVLTLGELRKGVLKLPTGRQRERLTHWMDNTLAQWFGERVVAIDLSVSAHWAQLLAQAGRPIPAIDSLLAASAVAKGLVVATRNVRDFELPGVTVFNPWEAA
jgi:toxin FitB